MSLPRKLKYTKTIFAFFLISTRIYYTIYSYNRKALIVTRKKLLSRKDKGFSFQRIQSDSTSYKIKNKTFILLCFFSVNNTMELIYAAVASKIKRYKI